MVGSTVVCELQSLSKGTKFTNLKKGRPAIGAEASRPLACLCT